MKLTTNTTLLSPPAAPAPAVPAASPSAAPLVEAAPSAAPSMDWRRQDLADYAAQHGISVATWATKAEILAAIEKGGGE